MDSKAKAQIIEQLKTLVAEIESSDSLVIERFDKETLIVEREPLNGVRCWEQTGERRYELRVRSFKQCEQEA